MKATNDVRISQGFDFYVKAEDPDLLIITETKVDKEFPNETLKTRYPVSLVSTTLARTVC